MTDRLSSAASIGPRSTVAGAGLAGLIAAVLTLLLAGPVLRHPRSVLFGDPGDCYGTLAGFQALAERRPEQPRGLELQPLSDYPAALLTRVVGPVAAYNMMLLVGFPLAAAAFFPAARIVTRSRAGSIVAALLFAFSPYHFAHAREHFDQSHIALFALVVWAALAVATTPRPRTVASLVLAVVVAGLGNGYFVVLAGPIVIAAAVAVASAQARRGRRATVLVVAVVALGVANAAVQYSRLHLFRTSLPHPANLERYSARPIDYLRPSTQHPWLGAAAAKLLAADPHGSTAVEQTLYLGLFALLAASWGVVRMVRGNPVQRRSAVVLLTVAILSFISSLPPGVGLSGMWQELCPPFRAAARFGLVVQLCVALLAGAGIAALGRRTLALVALVLIADYAVVPAVHVVEPVELSRWLAGHATAIADYPPQPFRHLRRFRTVGDARVLWYENLGAIDALRLAVATTPERLAGSGVTHVVVHDVTTPLPEGLREVARFGGDRVVQVDAPRPPVLITAGEFAAPEGNGRWLEGGRGVLRLALHPDLVRVEGELVATLRSLAVDRVLRVDLSAGSIQVAAGVAVEMSVPLVVGQGGARIVFEVDPPGRPADEVLGNGDPRPLAVLFADLRFVPRCERFRDDLGVCFGEGFLAREPDGRRWLKGPGRIGLAGAGRRLTMEVVAAGAPRRLRIACGDGPKLAEVEVGIDRWHAVAVDLPLGCGELLVDGGEPVSVDQVGQAGSERALTVAVRSVRPGESP